MQKALIICRSQTEALGVSRLLERAGIYGALTRPPRDGYITSCAYAVRIAASELDRARRCLQERNFASYQVRMIQM